MDTVATSVLDNPLPLLQCYTHRNLGWKILVVDPGQAVPDASAGSIFSSKQLLVELAVVGTLLTGLLYA